MQFWWVTVCSFGCHFGSPFTESLVSRKPGTVQAADVMFTDLLEGQYYHATEPETFCLTTNKPFKGTESSKVWMMNSSPALLNAVNTFMRKERLSDLAKKWNVSITP